MDDEPAMRLAVGALLQRMGHEVDLVEDGRKAVETYESAKTQGRPFDVVILDLTVRGGVGAMNAIQALAQIDPSVKAIVMSGYANDPVLLEPGRYGFKGALAKPFDLDSLRRVLTQVMGPGRPAARNQ